MGGEYTGHSQKHTLYEDIYYISVYAYVVLPALFLLAFEKYVFQMLEMLFCVGKRN